MSLSTRDAVTIQIEQEKHEIEQKLTDLEPQIADQIEKVSKASDARHKAWDKVEDSIPKKHEGKMDYADPKLVETAEAADRVFHAADKTLESLWAARNRYRQELKNLEDPTDEIDRRTETKERLKSLRDRQKEQRKQQREGIERKPKVVIPKVTAKEQGFPEVYLGPTGNFVPGSDATAKHDLVVAVLGIKEPVKHKFTKAQALKLLKARGWEGFVEKRKKSIVAEKARAEKAKS